MTFKSQEREWKTSCGRSRSRRGKYTLLGDGRMDWINLPPNGNPWQSILNKGMNRRVLHLTYLLHGAQTFMRS